MPMTENITQTAKFTAKASVLADNAKIWSRLYAGVLATDVFISPPPGRAWLAPVTAHSIPVTGASL
jgi:hypothetical protein